MTSHIPELTRCRAFHGLSEEDCQIWFGVGIGTLERMEAGQVEPSHELEQRIRRFLKAVGGREISPSFAHSRPSPTRGAGPTGGAGAVAPARAASFRDEGDML